MAEGEELTRFFLASVGFGEKVINSACGFSSTDVNSDLHKTHSPGSRLSYSVALNFISLDSDVTTSAGLSDSVIALQLAGANRFSKYFSASLGIGIFELDDENQFSQVVVDDDGFVRVEDSETRGTSFFGEISFSNTVTSRSSFVYAVGVGAARITKASRTISRCDSCDTTEFDFEGGGYALASVGGKFTDNSAFGLTGRQYFSGDLENSLVLWWQSGF